MKKGIKGFLGIMVSASLVMSPIIEAAAANQFDVAAEDVGGKVLFPGDSVSGITPIYAGPDGNAVDTEGSWKNETAQVYSMSGMEGEEGGLWLEPVGYVVTVNKGSSRPAGTQAGGDTSNHYKAKDGSQEAGKDIAYYPAWTDVTVTAEAAPEGQVFDHWQIDSANVTLTDAYAQETTFNMVDSSVILTAVYAEAPTEPPMTEAPVTEAPMTEAPAIEAPVTEAPITEAPATETPVTEAPIEIPTTGETDPDGVVIVGGETGGEDTSDQAAPQLYHLTVENGTGSGDYEVGTNITIEAAPAEGMEFIEWTANTDAVWFENSTSPATSFSMPAEEGVIVSAVYEETVTDVETETPGTETEAPATEMTETEAQTGTAATETPGTETPVTEEQPATEESPVLPNLYSVEVLNGEGGGTYEVGAEVTIYADAAPDGQQFAGWTASENVVLADPMAEETTFVMPEGQVSLTANYKEAETELPATEAPSTDAPITEPPVTETEEATENMGEQADELPGLNEETEAETQTPGTETPVTETESETETEIETETEAKTYNIELSNLDDVTVENGVTNEEGFFVAAAGSTVTVTATEYEDLVLSGWIVVRVDTKENITPTVSQEDSNSATFIMPNSTVYVEPVYEELNDNEVQVVNGSGSGSYLEGEYVEITANKPQAGYRFKGWTVVTGNVELDDAGAETTGFTMPDTPVQVKAVYEVVRYTLTVNNGSGSGSYVAGETVNLTANYPASGKVFAGWKVTSENASVAASDRYYSSITMPAANVTLEATYKAGPSPDYNYISGIESGAEYLKGQVISFSAVGNGMDNGNPNPGDYRYRPSGYKIGSVTGNWNNSSISMRIDAVGQYTLNVTYNKEVFDGNSWVADGTTDTKSVNFYVVNALSVQTGDDSPILPLVAAAAVALIIIIVVVVLKRRRR